MILYNNSKKIVIINKLIIADNFLKRLIGLMGKKNILISEGVIIKPCKCIHTFFMKFSLDLIFVDKSHRVVFIVKDIKPNNISPFIKNAESIIELKAGTIKLDKNISVGDFLKVV